MVRLVRNPPGFHTPPAQYYGAEHTHSVDESHVAQQEVEGAQINVMTLRGLFFFFLLVALCIHSSGPSDDPELCRCTHTVNNLSPVPPAQCRALSNKRGVFAEVIIFRANV